MSNQNESNVNKNNKFSYFEPIAGIIFAIAAVVVFLGFPQIMAVVFVNDSIIPTFNTEVIRSLWYLFVLWAIFRIAVEIFYIVEHSYTKRLAAVTIAGNVLAFICTLIIFVPLRIVNAEYIDWINTNFTDNAAVFGGILARPNIVIIVIMLIGLILDSFTVIWKGFKQKKEENDDDGKNDSIEAAAATAVETAAVKDSVANESIIEDNNVN